MIYKLELTQEHLAIISDALMAMPYGRVFTVITELKQQISAQQQATRPTAQNGPQPNAQVS